ncbi:hypothetical protein HDU86_007818 [Geranomyces michiganensis]|nr:hypothetical protein HDU86_007818 [Geranomyces michiganensis]
MVSFVCEACQETLKKPKLDQHTYRCQYAQFSCIDCSTTFQGTDYRAHTSCISEAEKYQGALYKGPKKNGAAAKNGKQTSKQASAATATKTTAATANFANAPPAESLIAQIQKADAAAAAASTTTTTTTTKRPLDTADETTPSKKSKKDKQKAIKKSEDTAAAAAGTPPADDHAPSTAPSELLLQASIRPAVEKILKKTPTLTIASLRAKTIKRVAKAHGDLSAEVIGLGFDGALSVSVGEGGRYIVSL